MLLTFCRGLFWVVTFPVWSGDEGAHYSYEQSVATGHGIPVAGRTLNSVDTLRLVKESPVSLERTMPIPPSPTPQWGIVDEQYEGLQSPLYYLLLVPVYWVGRAVGGVIGSFYALRLASLCLAVATIPLTALLARALLPQRRAVWVLAPAVIGVLQIVNVQNSYVDNDALTMVAGAACVLALLACRGDLRARRGALFGLTLAAAFLTKATLAALVPALLIAMVAYVVRRRPGVRPVAVWTAVAGGTAIVIMLPYLVFNLTEYHALNGAHAAAALIKPIIGSTPVSLAGAGHLGQMFLRTLFVGQGIAPPTSADQYQRLWEWAAVVSAAAALTGATLQRRWDELALVGWIVASIPLGVLALIVVGFSQSGGEATVVARYLDCLLPLFAILVGYGAIAVAGPRIGSLALLAVLVAASFVEVAGDRAWVRTTYTADIFGRSVPVVEQSYSDGWALFTNVRGSTACPADAVALDVLAPAPPAVAVNGRWTAGAEADGPWTEYRLARPVRGKLVIRTLGPVEVGTARHRGTVAGPGGSVAASAVGVPAVRLYCPVRDPADVRFGQLYRTDHPPLSLGTVLAWPEVEAWVEGGLVVGVAAAVAWSSFAPAGRHRRRPRSTHR
jgi:hypothetical protein